MKRKAVVVVACVAAAAMIAFVFTRPDPEAAEWKENAADILLRNVVASIDTDLVDEPKIQSRLMLIMGRIYMTLGVSDEAEQLFKKSYTHVQFARGFTVERALWDDDQYNIINKKPAGLALAAMRKREKDAASVFNNAFSAETGGDGAELCASDHPYSPTNAGTQSNEGTTALSYQAIVDTRELMRAYLDDRANLAQA